MWWEVVQCVKDKHSKLYSFTIGHTSTSLQRQGASKLENCSKSNAAHMTLRVLTNKASMISKL